MNKWNDISIKKEILYVMNSIGIQRMPTRTEILRETGNNSLDGGIQDNGGYLFWANKLSLDSKKPVVSWNEDFLREEIYSVMKILNISRMPTRSEIESCGNGKLSSYLSKYSFKEAAKRFGLETKNSETKFGRKWEEICYKFLTEKNYSVINTESSHAPYDLLVNNVVRMDVKSGCAYYLRGSRVHTFGINKKYPSCDIYVVYALDETGEKIERIFVIPSIYLKIKSLSIGKESKYNIYLDSWHYLDSYIDFLNSL